VHEVSSAQVSRFKHSDTLCCNTFPLPIGTSKYWFHYSYYVSGELTHFHYFQIGIECLPYIQSCVNPFVYCFMSKKFRESVRASCGKIHPDCNLHACLCHVGLGGNVSQHYELDSKLSQGTGHSRLTTVRHSTSRSASLAEDPFSTGV
jgi:hypothetical protein